MNLSNLILHLSLIKTVGDGTIQLLLENLSTDQLANLYSFKVDDYLNLGFSYTKANLLAVGLRDLDLLNRELELIQKCNAQWVTILDKNYPELLRHIQGAPAVLYWRGTLKTWPALSLAIVGSRKANYYGKSVINEIVPSLVQMGCAIVSGGAFGADTMAHRATLAAGGTTLAVFGTGLMHSYPKANARLFSEIIDSGGAVLSTFSMNTEGHPGHFPARNRIISGLSNGCLVVQAAIKSGAKITANLALDQGREVFVVPGLFGDPLSAGCHALAQQGAKIIHSVDDILVDLPGGTHFIQTAQAPKLASEIDTLIVSLCRMPININDLKGQIDIEMNDLQGRLFDLQLQGHVKQNFAGLWER